MKRERKKNDDHSEPSDCQGAERLDRGKRNERVCIFRGLDALAFVSTISNSSDEVYSKN